MTRIQRGSAATGRPSPPFCQTSLPNHGDYPSPSVITNLGTRLVESFSGRWADAINEGRVMVC